MEAHSLVVLTDGSPTRAVRGDLSAGISAPDISLVDMVMAHCFSWEAIPELGSDLLLLLLIWDKDIKVEHVHTRMHPNYPIADCPLLHKCLDNSIHVVLSVGSLSRLLDAFCYLLKRAESEAVPMKAVHKREIYCMNAKLKQLIQKCDNCTGISELIACNGWR